MKRRTALKKLGLGMASMPFLSFSGKDQAVQWDRGYGLEYTSDEEYWKQFKKAYYAVSEDFINLENGYFGIHPKSVHDAYLSNIKKVNTLGSNYMRNDFFPELAQIVQSLEVFSGVEEG